MKSPKKRAGSDRTSNGLFPDESPDIRRDVAALIADADQWMEMPNDRLGGQKPAELIGTPREQFLRDLLRAIKYGLLT